jgi:hypothetical protein
VDARSLVAPAALGSAVLVIEARNATRFALLLVGYNSPAQIDEALADLRRRRPGVLVVNRIFAADDNPVRRAVEPDYELVARLPGYRVYRRHALAAPRTEQPVVRGEQGHE